MSNLTHDLVIGCVESVQDTVGDLYTLLACTGDKSAIGELAINLMMTGCTLAKVAIEHDHIESDILRAINDIGQQMTDVMSQQEHWKVEPRIKDTD